MRKKILVGDKFGLLTVKELLPSIKHAGKTRRVWKCSCDCGSEIDIIDDHLRLVTQIPRSCGCYVKDSFWKKTISERNSWYSMLNRCYKEKDIGYEHYGGRGIVVCDRWLESFENFLEDMGTKPKGYSIDRIDVNGNYEPYNCKWSTASEQNVNKRRTGKPTSGKAGVNWHKKLSKWEVKISDNGKQLSLGVYDNFETAVKVRQNAELKYYGKLLPY
jgi:hypothetical protein